MKDTCYKSFISGHISVTVAPEFFNLIKLKDDINIDSHKYTDYKSDIISTKEISYKYLESYQILFPVLQAFLTFPTWGLH